MRSQPHSSKLFAPATLGKLTLSNRIVMAPMARGRADVDNCATAMMATYYAQRASAGLIIAEATAVAPEGRNYHRCTAIYDTTQAEAWRPIVQEVHRAGGKIILQLLHAGRAAHELTLGHPPWAPSAIAATTKTLTRAGFMPCSTPRAMTSDDISSVVESFVSAARNARAAGFDGVEVHAANGYLIDQFLKDGTNRRTDAFGGSIENRTRLLLQIVDALIEAMPDYPIGVRIAPGPAQNAVDSDPMSLFLSVVRSLSTRPLLYLHAIEGTASGATSDAIVDHSVLRRAFAGPWITNNGYDLDRAEQVIANGTADLVSFGRPFIANPDLVARLRNGLALAVPDKDLLFFGEDKGFTDYPAAR